MKVTEEIINGEVYTVTEYDSGHIIKELKMTEAQKAIMNTPQPPAPDLLTDIKEKLDKLIADVAKMNKV